MNLCCLNTIIWSFDFADTSRSWQRLQVDLRQSHDPSSTHMTLNCDNTLVAICYQDFLIEICDLQSQKLRSKLLGGHGILNDSAYAWAQWHPQLDRQVVCLDYNVQTVKWNIDRDTLSRFDAINPQRIAISPNGKYLATVDDHAIWIYVYDTMDQIFESTNLREPSKDICFSSDSRRIYRLTENSCEVWEPAILNDFPPMPLGHPLNYMTEYIEDLDSGEPSRDKEQNASLPESRYSSVSSGEESMLSSPGSGDRHKGERWGRALAIPVDEDLYNPSSSEPLRRHRRHRRFA